MTLLAKLNEAQKQAVTHTEGTLLIVAGAGTGKTTVITHRIAWLIEQKLASTENILALTFTEKAAMEMEDRVLQLLPLGYFDLFVSTFHAFCERILQTHALDIGIPNHFTVLDQTAQWMLLKRHLHELKLNYYRPMGNPTKFLHALVKHFSRCKDELITPNEYLQYVEELKLNKDEVFLPTMGEGDTAQEIERLTELASAYAMYQRLLLEQDALDFGDLINFTLELFRKRPNILAQYRQQFRYILVDEFQDTNYAQYELIKLLAAPRNNLTVVGDDDQSIYKFRGASVSNILGFLKDFPETKEIFLTTNYRSRQNILDLAYRFIQLNNPDRLEAKFLHKGLQKQLTTIFPDTGEVICLQAENIQEEVDIVLKKIIELSRTQPNTSWNDFAILVRANDHAMPFIRRLEELHIPYIFLANRGLYTKPIILDILAFLRLIHDSHESGAFYRLLNLPFFQIPEQDIIILNHFALKKTISLYEAAKIYTPQSNLSSKTRAVLITLFRLIEKGMMLKRETNVRMLILFFLEKSGYLKYLQEQEERHLQEDFRILNQFDAQVQRFVQAQSEPTVKNYLEELEYILGSGDTGTLFPNPEEGPELVKVMTIHAAKGLEFRYVFLVNLVDKRFPTIERKDALSIPEKFIKEQLPEGDFHLQEERRLFYVACTRAKEHLYCTWARDCGGSLPKKPSRFLVECGMLASVPVREKKKRDQALQKFKLEIGKNVEYTPSKTFDRGAQRAVPRFSFTQIRAFETCPLQYKFAHILKIPVRGKAVFSFGKTMHITLQHFYEMALERAAQQQQNLFQTSVSSALPIRRLVSLEELLSIYEKSWIDDWYTDTHTKEEYRKLGEKTLRTFYDSLEDTSPLPTYLEKGFSMKMDRIIFKGVIDRIDILSDGGMEIIDYKTGRAKEKLTAEDKEQLLIYQMACQELFQTNPAKLTFYYLDMNKRLSFLGTEEEIDALKEKIAKIADEIQKGKFRATPSPEKCRYCDFASICSFSQASGHSI